MTKLLLPTYPDKTTQILPAPNTSVWRRAGFTLLMALSVLVLLAPPSLLPSRDRFLIGLLSRAMALAVLALSVDLVWGYSGLLSLGQGLYFGLGAYAIAYSLALQKAATDAQAVPGTVPPDFMVYGGLAPNHPDYVTPAALHWIAPLANIWVALAVAILLPILVASIFGLLTFRLRIKGVYFALITQALLLAMFFLVRSLLPITGGFVGIKNLAPLTLWGHTFDSSKEVDPTLKYPQLYWGTDDNLPAFISTDHDPDTSIAPFDWRLRPMKHFQSLFYLQAVVLLACLLGCALLMSSKFGKVMTAIRDNENRVLALGYNTALYKAFLFALAGGLAGLAGGMYVSANELCGPTYVSVPFSIIAVIWVAVGGRGNLLGAIVGAVLIAFCENYISSAFPLYWTIILGALFLVVVVCLPMGLVGAAGRGALVGTVLGVVYAEKFVAVVQASPLVQKWLLAHSPPLGTPFAEDQQNHPFAFLPQTLNEDGSPFGLLPPGYGVIVGCAFIVLMIFLPRILEYVVSKAVGLVWRRWMA